MERAGIDTLRGGFWAKPNDVWLRMHPFTQERESIVDTEETSL